MRLLGGKKLHGKIYIFSFKIEKKFDLEVFQNQHFKNFIIEKNVDFEVIQKLQHIVLISVLSILLYLTSCTKYSQSVSVYKSLAYSTYAIKEK